MINHLLDARAPAKNLQIYLAGCLTACQTQTEGALHKDIAQKVWGHHSQIKQDLTSLTVIGHLATSEQGRFKESNTIADLILKSRITAPIRKMTHSLSRRIGTNPLYVEIVPLVVGLLLPLATQFGLPDSIALTGFVSGIGRLFVGQKPSSRSCQKLLTHSPLAFFPIANVGI